MRLVNVEEAAEALGVSPTFIYRLPSNTTGVYRFGKAVRLSIEELREWASRQAGQKDPKQKRHAKSPLKTARIFKHPRTNQPGQTSSEIVRNDLDPNGAEISQCCGMARNSAAHEDKSIQETATENRRHAES
jgi:excisionase family DNA binding protein